MVNDNNNDKTPKHKNIKDRPLDATQQHINHNNIQFNNQSNKLWWILAISLIFSQNNMVSHPSNPREDLIVKLEPDDLRGLEDNDILCMNLLDFILDLICTHYINTNDINYHLGGTVTRQLLP